MVSGRNLVNYVLNSSSSILGKPSSHFLSLFLSSYFLTQHFINLCRFIRIMPKEPFTASLPDLFPATRI